MNINQEFFRQKVLKKTTPKLIFMEKKGNKSSQKVIKKKRKDYLEWIKI